MKKERCIEAAKRDRREDIITFVGAIRNEQQNEEVATRATLPSRTPQPERLRYIGLVKLI
jgi:hypothetical protein